MGSVTVLLSAMELHGTDILKKLKITGPSIIINQCGSVSREYYPDDDCLYICSDERGLSKSRNMAVREAAVSGKELCIFCDNDVLYEDDYEEIIEKAFDRNPDSDILVFFVERPERSGPVYRNERDLGLFHSMKIFSPEIAFRLSGIRRAGLKMDELFGAGAKYGMGEENIFLFDARRAGLKITYVPIRIAGTVENESSWFKGYTPEFFRNRGAGYYRMSPALFPFLCLQYAVRKKKLYADTVKPFQALKMMWKGKAGYLNEDRYFIVGDHYSGTGPANATKSLISAMPSNTLYLKSRNKLLRALEIRSKIRSSKAVVFSGHSRQNIFGMKYAAEKGIPSVYIMHGAVAYENRINRVPDDGMASDEARMMKLADRILAVSAEFERWLKKNYPEYESKTGHLTNGVDWAGFYVNRTRLSKDTGSGIHILSVGGGMPRKRINKICEAVSLLKVREGLDIILHVAGDRGADSDEIASYDFVCDHGLIDREEMKALYGRCRLFIQNSVFETFGLAPVEALLSGCDIIMSGCCGVKEIFGGFENADIISDPDDVNEIAEKISAVLKSGNNERLKEALDMRETGWEVRAEELCRILKSMEK